MTNDTLFLVIIFLLLLHIPSNIVQKYFHFVSMLYQFLSPCKVITKLKYVDTIFCSFLKYVSKIYLLNFFKYFDFEICGQTCHLLTLLYRLWLRKWAANMHLDFGGKIDNLYNTVSLRTQK